MKKLFVALLLCVCVPAGFLWTRAARRDIRLQSRESVRQAVLRSAVAALSARERQIMELRFGLTDGVERTQKEAADALGISQSYISRLEKRIIHTLKARLESE